MEYIFSSIANIYHTPNHPQCMHPHMCELGGKPEYVNSPTRGWVCTLHTSQTKDAQNTDRSSNCIQWIIKLHGLHHSCPDDRGGGEGMRPGLGLNARRVPMQFGLIKKPRGLHSNASPRRWPSPQVYRMRSFMGLFTFLGDIFTSSSCPETLLIADSLVCVNTVDTHGCLRCRIILSTASAVSPEREREKRAAKACECVWVCVFRTQLFTLTQKPVTITLKNKENLVKDGPWWTFARSAEHHPLSTWINIQHGIWVWYWSLYWSKNIIYSDSISRFYVQDLTLSLTTSCSQDSHGSDSAHS